MASIKEQREKLAKKIATLQAREKDLASKEAEQERKARTRRLIELGAIIESKLSDDAIFVLRHIDRSKCAEIDEWATKYMSEAKKIYDAIESERQLKIEATKSKRAKKKPNDKTDDDEKENENKQPSPNTHIVPRCKRCGVEMIKKQSTSDKNKGRLFWACPNAKYGDGHEFGGWVD